MTAQTQLPAGQRSGRLTVVGPARATNGGRAWLCGCDCGKETVVKTHDLKSGNTRSCGCLAADKLRERNTVHGDAARSNGRKRPRLYGIWARMRQRCLDPNTSDFARYGARGIQVCREWGGYEGFRDWALASGYQDDLTIDRIDNEGNYYPGNCRWADLKTQARNKRNNHLIEYQGETLPLPEWAERLGIAPCTLKMRLRNGWPVERAMTEPVRGWSPGVAADG